MILRGLAVSLLINILPQPVFARPVWAISLEPDRLLWVAGELNTVNAKLKNLTDHTLWVFSTNPLSDYNVSVSNEGGTVVPMTPKGIRIKEAQNTIETRATRQRIPSGESYTTQLNLGELYSLMPGKYTVTVSLATFAEDNFDAQLNRPVFRKKQNTPSASIAIQVGP